MIDLEKGFKMVKSVYGSGLLIVPYSGDEAIYIDVNDKKKLFAGRIRDFDPRWGSGSFNANRLRESQVREVPKEISKVLWPIAGDEAVFFEPVHLHRKIEKLNLEEIEKAVEALHIFLVL